LKGVDRRERLGPVSQLRSIQWHKKMRIRVKQKQAILTARNIRCFTSFVGAMITGIAISIVKQEWP